jgi:hypothetical protein
MVCIIQLGEPGGGPHAHFLLSFGERLLLGLGLLLFYFKLILWPVGLSLYYEFPLELAQLLPLGVLSLVLLGLLFYVASKDREGILLFSLLSYLLLLVPVLNLFPITTLANDRYLYLSIAFFTFFVWRAVSLWSFPPARWLAISVFIAACVLMSFSTIRRVAAWENPNALWEDTYRKAPHLPNVRRIWAEQQAIQGRVDLALKELGAILSDKSLHPEDRRTVEESMRVLVKEIARQKAAT